MPRLTIPPNDVLRALADLQDALKSENAQMGDYGNLESNVNIMPRAFLLSDEELRHTGLLRVNNASLNAHGPSEKMAVAKADQIGLGQRRRKREDEKSRRMVR